MNTTRIKDKIIDGRTLATNIKMSCKDFLSHVSMQPTLVIIQVGHDPASDVYVKGKKKDCAEIGITCKHIEYPTCISEVQLCREIQALNQDNAVNGILVQLPLPNHMDPYRILTTIDPSKDVDGFHPANLGALWVDKPTFVSCTPLGILALVKSVCDDVTGKQVVVIGRSHHVGKPTAFLFTKENATVTLTHSKTKNLAQLTRQADILIVAMGQPQFIDHTYIKEGAIVIDVGIHRQKDGHLYGDVQFDDVYDHVKAITPVPGGVGPMTRAMLMYNCILATCKQHGFTEPSLQTFVQPYQNA